MSIALENRLRHALVHAVVLREQDAQRALQRRPGPGRRRCRFRFHRLRDPGAHDEMERAALAGLALEPEAPRHAFHQARRNAEAKTGATEFSRRRLVRLLEGLEDGRLLIRGNADAGVLHLEMQCDGSRLRREVRLRLRDAQRDATGRGELDRVADEVAEHLRQTMGIAAQHRRHVRRDVAAQVNAFVARAHAERPDQQAHGVAEREVALLEGELARLDLREIEHVVDHGEQDLGRAFRHVQVLALHRLQIGAQHQIGHAKHAVHRRADLMAHIREERAFRSRGDLGGLFRVLQLVGPLVHEPLELLLACFQRLHAQPVTAGEREPERQHGERIEPSRLIKAWCEINRITVAAFVPDAVVVGGFHAERVTARRDVAVVRRAAIAGVNPVAIVPVEPVPEADLFRREKTQACIAEREVTASRLRLRLLPSSEHVPVDGGIFDAHRRRKRVDGDCSGIHDAQTDRPRHPDAAIARLVGARRMTDRPYCADESMFQSVDGRRDGSYAALGKIVELTFADAERALAASHPQAAMVVFDDVIHEARIQPVAHGIGRELAVLESVQPLAGPDPQRVVLVHEERLHTVGGQAVLLGIGGEGAVPEAGEPTAPRANPQRSVAILLYGANEIAGKPFVRRVPCEHATAVRDEPLEAGADPERAVAIFEQHSGKFVRDLGELRIALCAPTVERPYRSEDAAFTRHP